MEKWTFNKCRGNITFEKFEENRKFRANGTVVNFGATVVVISMPTFLVLGPVWFLRPFGPLGSLGPLGPIATFVLALRPTLVVILQKTLANCFQETLSRNFE